MTCYMPGLRALRVSRNLSVSDVAHYMEVSPGTVKKWEEGANAPRTRNLIALAVLFKTTPDALLEFGEHEWPLEMPQRRMLRRVK